ncbi:MAG TPA: hypothetical protein VM658_02630 [bacterium]|nr:hypothetical protein [bacterium]
MMRPRDEYKGGEIRLDKEGRWFHEGVEITHRLTLDLFNRSIKRHPGGGYCLEVGPECARIVVEDTPYMVKRVDLDGGGARIRVSDGTEEPLDPSTLRIGPENVLYCTVKGEFPARFLRPAYYQLMQGLTETEDGYAVEIGGRLWPLAAP